PTSWRCAANWRARVDLPMPLMPRSTSRAAWVTCDDPNRLSRCRVVNRGVDCSTLLFLLNTFSCFAYSSNSNNLRPLNDAAHDEESHYRSGSDVHKPPREPTGDHLTSK